MTGVKNQITTGNLVSAAFTLGTAAVLFAVAWGALNNSLGAMAKGLDDHETRLRIIERETMDRLTRIEAIVGRIYNKVGQ